MSAEIGVLKSHKSECIYIYNLYKYIDIYIHEHIINIYVYIYI